MRPQKDLSLGLPLITPGASLLVAMAAARLGCTLNWQPRCSSREIDSLHVRKLMGRGTSGALRGFA